MQAADDVQLGNSDGQRLARFLHDLFYRELKTICIALFSRKRAELAAQDAIIGIINVAIDDVTGAIAHFALPDKVCDGADRIQVFALEEPQRVSLTNALPLVDSLV